MKELMTTVGAFMDVVDARVRAMFDSYSEEQSSELYYKDLGLNDYEPDVPNEQMADVTGPGRGTITVEGEEYGSNSKVKGYPITVNLRKYTFDLEWTEEDVHWLAKQSKSKRTSELRESSQGAVNSLQQNINEDTAKVYYLGHGTTFLTVGNSEALFGAHTIRGTSETQYNNFGSGSTHKALGASSLLEAIAIMNRFKAHNGIQIKRVKNLKLLVSPEKIAEANKLIFSLYGPDNANLGLSQASREMLSKRKINIEAIEIPDFPSAYATYWSLIDTERAKTRAFMAWGWKPRMKRDEKPSKGIFKEVGSTYFGPAIRGWQWAFGSKGDATSI